MDYTEIVPLESQSHVLAALALWIYSEGPERIHVSVHSKNRPEHYEKNFTYSEDLNTLYDPLRRGCRIARLGNCLGWRPSPAQAYQWLSYQVVLERAVHFGAGLRFLGLGPKDFVGIYSKNRVEWVLSEQGLFTHSMVSVPLYDTLGPTACHFVIEQTELTTVILEDEKKLENLLKSRPLPPSLKHIICMDSVRSAKTLEEAQKASLRLYEFTEVEAWGRERKADYPDQPPDPEDIATINYTSGTTGTPKGVILLHKNVVASVSSLLVGLQSFQLSPSDVTISYLPLAHMYERNCLLLALSFGGGIGFYSGDILKLMEDIKMLRPTVFPCVPRILNRIHDNIIASASRSLLTRSLLNIALWRKSEEVRRGVVRRDSIWDSMVFSRIQEALGGRLRFLYSSASPIHGSVLEVLRTALGCHVFEGYGQTECSGAFTNTLALDVNSKGHVGPPCVPCAVKLVDVPDMDYYSENDEGEICVKSSMVFSGYFKNEEETEKVFDEDGWMHTGDIGTWLPNGTLKVIDRKKNILKLSQGEYVAPERIENIYLRSPLVAQVFVHGNSLMPYVVGILFPEFESLRANFPDKDMKALCADPEVKALVLEELGRLGKEAGLHSFEQVKKIHLHPEAFTLEQGLVTPTMKIIRAELCKRFATQITEMYSGED